MSVSFINAQEILGIEPVEHLPAKLLPSGAVSFGILKGEYGLSHSWGCKYQNGTYKTHYQLGPEFDGPMMDYFTLDYINGKIVLTYQVVNHPQENLLIYTWDGKKIILVEEKYGDDANDAVLDSAERALKGGDIQGAVRWFHNIQYPSNYINEDQTAIDLLSLAHNKGLSAFKRQNYQLACDYIQQALKFYAFELLLSAKTKNQYDDFTDGYVWKENKDSVGLWLGDYGYFLYKADSLESSIKLNTYLNMVYPNLSGPFLQLGDAFFDQNKINEAKTAYEQYIKLMKAKGKEKYIPQRVYDRIDPQD